MQHVVRFRVPNWSKFDASAFEYEFASEKLLAHGIADHEAAQVFWNGFRALKNKGYRDRYQIIGLIDGGRPLKLIVHVRAKTTIRVITGWPL